MAGGIEAKGDSGWRDAESASRARARPGCMIVGGSGSAGLIVAAQLLRALARPDWASWKPQAVTDATHPAGIPAWAGLLALRGNPTVSDGRMIPAGASGVQGRPASFEPQARGESRAARRALSYDVLVWHGSSSIGASGSKGCRRHSAATASSATTHAPTSRHMGGVSRFQAWYGCLSATLLTPIKLRRLLPER